MAIINFIELFASFDEAMYIRESPMTQFYEVRGVQLLPNNPYPYRQTTNVSEGIELEDWQAFVVDYCTGEKTDISDYFLVDRIFTDDNGMAQFDWSITNLPFDFGESLVYLQIDQLIGESFYSNLFQIKEDTDNETTRLDYRNSSNDTMQSIQLRMWYWQSLKNQEIDTYYETSTRNTVTTLIKSQKHERWVSDIISNDLWIKISDVFENKFVYVDLVRSYLFEALEVKEFEFSQNFAQNIFKLSFNNTDSYNPLSVEIGDDLIPSISLNQVDVNGLTATYYFTYANFNPTYFVFQYSQDQINWIDSTKGVSSPQVNRLLTKTGTLYFRIEHPEAISNVIQIDLLENVVAYDNYGRVPKNGSSVIEVLLNDVLVGDTVITAVGTATHGTVEIINDGTQIRYTHDGGVGESDEFTYTISNGQSSDSATVSLIIRVPYFNTTERAYSSAQLACDAAFDTVKYIDGNSFIPSVGDTIYNDEALTSVFDGSKGFFIVLDWHPVSFEGKAVRIGNSGEVLEVKDC